MDKTHTVSEESDDAGVRGLGPLVRTLFGSFEAHGLSWGVLRGYENLPDATRYDLDILLRPADLARAAEIVRTAAAAHDWRVIGHIDKYRYQCLILASPDARQFLPIDLFAGCWHRFYCMADVSIGLEHRRHLREDVWHVPPGFAALVALVKELMRHDTFKENSRAEVQRGCLNDSASFLQGGLRTLGPSITERLLQACQEGDWGRVESLASEIRNRIGRQRWRRLPAAARFLWKNALHHLRPSMSLQVVLLGPDGAGKSTIADELCRRMRQRPFKVCRHFEYNFRIMPQLKRIRAAILRCLGRHVAPAAAPAAGFRGSGMNPEHSPARGLFYVAYYTLDLAIGHWIVRRLRGQSALIVFARYFHDYYYQRGYGRVPRWALRLLERLVPEPDLILYLHRDAAEIYAGKPELDLPEIQRQQAVIAELLADRSNAQVIDASLGVASTAERAVEAILNTLLSKQGRIRTARDVGDGP